MIRNRNKVNHYKINKINMLKLINIQE